MSGERGFTLVEVLVAGLLLFLALAVTATMSLTAYGQLDRSEEQTITNHLNQERIALLRNQGYNASELNAGTRTELLTANYTGFTRVTQIQDDTPVTGVKQITVVTNGPSGLSSRVVTLMVEP